MPIANRLPLRSGTHQITVRPANLPAYVTPHAPNVARERTRLRVQVFSSGNYFVNRSEIFMSRPKSPHVTALKEFRDRLVEARRAAAREDNIELALRRFTDIETAIGLVDKAIINELDLTPLPAVDDPTRPPPEVEI